jgi:hypothetical protein
MTIREVLEKWKNKYYDHRVMYDDELIKSLEEFVDHEIDEWNVEWLGYEVSRMRCEYMRQRLIGTKEGEKK